MVTRRPAHRRRRHGRRGVARGGAGQRWRGARGLVQQAAAEGLGFLQLQRLNGGPDTEQVPPQAICLRRGLASGEMGPWGLIEQAAAEGLKSTRRCPLPCGD